MNLLDASKLVLQGHVDEAVRRVDAHEGYGWLYEQTGRQEPNYRYIVVKGRRYPSKALGFLVAQLAGGTAATANDMNVNQAVAPLRKLGYVEVTGARQEDSPAQQKARRDSYYLALARPQQSKFRQLLLDAYGGTCPVSKCTISTILEAAHVQPFRSRGEDSLGNGILLRVDLHRLFDSGELAINPSTLRTVFSVKCAEHYPTLMNYAVTLPLGGPPPSGFQERWKVFSKNHTIA